MKSQFLANSTNEQSNTLTEQKDNAMFYISHLLKFYQIWKQQKQVIPECLLWRHAIFKQGVSSFECTTGRDNTTRIAKEGTPCKASNLDSW